MADAGRSCVSCRPDDGAAGRSERRSRPAPPAVSMIFSPSCAASPLSGQFPISKLHPVQGAAVGLDTDPPRDLNPTGGMPPQVRGGSLSGSPRHQPCDDACCSRSEGYYHQAAGRISLPAVQCDAPTTPDPALALRRHRSFPHCKLCKDESHAVRSVPAFSARYTSCGIQTSYCCGASPASAS